MTQAAAQRRVYVKAEWRAGCPKDGQLRGFADLMTPPGFGSAHLQENRIERELAATRSRANGPTSGSNPSPNHKTYFFKTMLYSHAAVRFARGPTWPSAERQSGLIPACFTTAPHREDSSRMNAPYSSG